MKRFGELLIAFLIVMVIVYMKPVVLSYNQPKQENSLEIADLQPVEQSVRYNELNATGMATYIGMTENNFLKTKPKPLKEYKISEHKKWLLYGDNSEDYYQVEVIDGVISSVFSLGNMNETSPFQIGMTLSDISEITTIYSNFDFDYEGNNYSIEFTENDMSYRPLVAFNNDSFALLHFSSNTGELIGIRYLDKKTLLTLVPPKKGDFKVDENIEVDEANKAQLTQAYSDQLLNILNVLRETNDSGRLTRDHSLSTISKQSLSEMNRQPDTIFKKESRLIGWEQREDKKNNFFELNDDELKRVIQKGHPNSKKIHGLYASYVFDIPCLVMDWYGEYYSFKELTDKKDQVIGISMEDQQLLILLSPKTSDGNSTIESSDSK